MEPVDPRALRNEYQAFLGGRERVLLTGHSHQAWPDVARAAMARAFDDAALHVDDKWGPAFEAADAVRAAIAARIGGARADEIALAQNTHELVARFLSALDLRGRPHLVTTSGEFHTIDRQLHRLAEAGVEVTFVDAAEPRTLAERLTAAVRADTAAVLVSSVLFQSASVVPGLGSLVAQARARGAHVLVDAYHAFQVTELEAPHPDAFVVGGGYKYAQLGEGVCFLRVPSHLGEELRPLYTGWFAGFGDLAASRTPGEVPYPKRAADRFAGSTYDPVSHYRARAVFAFFERQGLTPARLRATSLRQTARILAGLEGSPGLEIRTPREDAARAGFVAVRVDDAPRVVAALRARGVLVDARGDTVRLGPAPYLLDEEIDQGVRVLREVCACR